MNTHLFQYTIHLADNAMIIGQRNSEWCGHGPVLEQDIAITNITLDLLGQANNLYTYAASVYNAMSGEEKAATDHLIPVPWKTYGRPVTEDDLCFLREENQYYNLLITEQARGDWARTILRQFFFSAYQFYLYTNLQRSSDQELAAIAAKSLKEVTYHLRWSSEWVIRLGDGTTESHERMKKALEDLWSYTGELITPVDYELKAAELGFGIDPANFKTEWLEKTKEILAEATLSIPAPSWMQSGGKSGRHSEQLGFILAEMQHLQRTYPNVQW